ncbi:MAG: hypothetical protein DRJ15_12705, partial [Bacteroidetes bacterium]
MDTLIIIPVYNEAANIARIIMEINEKFPEYDILVVNDASTDGSGAIAEEIGKAAVVNLPYNLGIGGAVQTGFKYAREKDYAIALQFDGDGQHQVNEISKLVEVIDEGGTDVVIGSRFNKKTNGFTTHTL